MSAPAPTLAAEEFWESHWASVGDAGPTTSGSRWFVGPAMRVARVPWTEEEARRFCGAWALVQRAEQLAADALTRLLPWRERHHLDPRRGGSCIRAQWWATGGPVVGVHYGPLVARAWGSVAHASRRAGYGIPVDWEPVPNAKRAALWSSSWAALAAAGMDVMTPDGALVACAEHPNPFEPLAGLSAARITLGLITPHRNEPPGWRASFRLHPEGPPRT